MPRALLSENEKRPERFIRGQPFLKGQSGNPSGRPRGARNRSTIAAQVLLEGEAEALTRKAVELALAGDLNALKLCFERILPPSRDEPFEPFELRKLETMGDAPDAIADLIAAVATGNITLSQANGMTALIDTYIRSCLACARDGREVDRAIDEQFDRQKRQEEGVRFSIGAR